jgi:hypothetical protein
VIRRIFILVVLLVLSFVVLTARAETPAAVTSFVRTVDGEAIAGASVSLTIRSKDFEFTGVTDRQGRYTFRPVPAGEYQFRANHRDYAGCSLKFTVNQGEARRMDIVLPALSGTRERASRVAAAELQDASYEREALATPGIANTGDGSFAEIRANGRSGSQNRVRVDGIDGTPFFPVPRFRPRLPATIESVQDVHVDASLYASDIGTGSGAQIRLTSRRGGEQWHGAQFENARGAPSGLRADRFGGSAGGALVADRLFVFGAAERLRQTTERRQQELLPQMNYAAAAVSDGVWREHVAESGYGARLDYHPGARDGLFLRYATRKASLASRDGTTADAAADVTTAWTTSRPRFTSDLRAGFTRMPINSWRANETTYLVAEAGSTMFRLPGGDHLSSFDYRPRTWTVREGMSWGEWEAGAEVRFIRVPVRQGARMIYSFASADEYTADRPYSASYFGPIDEVTGAQQLYSAYVQRQWRMRRSLVVNGGMRYELYTVNREVHGRARVFDAARLDYIDGPFYTAEKLGFAPRLGLAWSPAARTVIRAGAGVHYGPGSYGDLMQAIENMAAPVQVTGGRTVGLPAGVDVKNYRVPERDFQYGASLEQQIPARLVAQAAYLGGHGRHLLLESVANLITAVDLLTGELTRENTAYGEIPLTTSGGDNVYNSLQALLTRRFAGGFSATAAYTWATLRGHSADAVQDPRCLMCERSPDPDDIRHSVAGNAAYSWHAWTVTGMWTARSGMPVNVLIDRPDAVLANGAWVMSTPGGGAHRTAQRPDLVPGSDPYLRLGRQWLNPAAFSSPLPGNYGTLARNVLRGPGLARLDVALARSVRLTERLRLQFRAAVYDLTGRIDYRNPTNVLPHAGFGYLATPIVQAGAVRAGRDAEAELRLVF